MDADLKKFVIWNIKDDQSPEGISGRLKHIEKELNTLSGKAIYKFIASPHGDKLRKSFVFQSSKEKSLEENEEHPSPLMVELSLTKDLKG